MWPAMAVVLTLDEGPVCGVRRGDACVFHPPDWRLVGKRDGHLVVDDGHARGGLTAVALTPDGLMFGTQPLSRGDDVVVGDHRLVVDVLDSPPALAPRHLEHHLGRVWLLRLVRIGPGPRSKPISVWDAVTDEGRLVTATVSTTGQLTTGPRVSGVVLPRLLDGGRVDDERAAAIAKAGATYLLGTRLRLDFDGVVCADWTSSAPVGRRYASRGGLFSVLSGQALDPLIADAAVAAMAEHVDVNDLAALVRQIAGEAWLFEEQLRDEAAMLVM
jgi:hypothetical protein